MNSFSSDQLSRARGVEEASGRAYKAGYLLGMETYKSLIARPEFLLCLLSSKVSVGSFHFAETEFLFHELSDFLSLFSLCFKKNASVHTPL